MLKADKIYVAGHRGMVGSACVRALKAAGFENIVMRTHSELDLLDPAAVRAFYEAEKPDVAIIAAARVGGIGANSAANSQFLYENELIALNTVWSAAETGVKRLLFLGSTCIYPRMAPQPIPESALLTSELEKTNEGYALAKISGLKLCEFLRRERGLVYHSLMPTNLYGPGDNYDTEYGHVLPTMIRKFETARVNGNQTVTLWGSGSPLREFLHVDDLASACLFLLELEDPPDLVNVGSGREVTIRQLAEMVKEATGSQAFIEWDRTKPDGTPRKLCDTRLIRKLGWAPKIDLVAGLRRNTSEDCKITFSFQRRGSPRLQQGTGARQGDREASASRRARSLDVAAPRCACEVPRQAGRLCEARPSDWREERFYLGVRPRAG